MKYEQGDRWLKERLQMPTNLSSKGLSGIAPAIRAQAFFSAKVAQGHVLDALRRVSDAFTRGEMDLATARLRIKDALGVRYEPGSKEDHDLGRLASTARLNLILRQNARMAMAVGEYEQGRDPAMERMFPFWRYVASTSSSPRPDHQAFAGRVFRKDDPIWHRIFPPWDFNCKCSVEEVAADEVEPGMVEPPTLDRDRLPDMADSGFQFDPADALRTFDPALIQDEELRKGTVEELENRYGCTVRKDGKLEMPDNTPGGKTEYDQWVAEHSPHAPVEDCRWDDEAIQNLGDEVVTVNIGEYGSNEQEFRRTDGLTDECIGRYELKSFSPCPMRDAVAESLKEVQKICREASLPGFRAIVRMPIPKNSTWHAVPIANTSDGILCLNEKKLHKLFIGKISEKNESVWKCFTGIKRIRCIILHELGHQIYNQLVHNIKLPNLEEIINILFDRQNGNHRFSSCDKLKEWFAENYCAWKMDEKLMDNPEISDIFSQIFKQEKEG